MDMLGDYDDVEEASEVVIDPFAHVADSDSDSDSDAGETSKTARKVLANPRFPSNCALMLASLITASS